MWPSAVIVPGPLSNNHLQMVLVEGNQEVETFATKAAESLAHRVRLWGPHRRTQNPYTQIGKTLVDILREDAVAIVDDEAVRMIARQGLPELLQRPFRRGMGSDVLVENLAGSDLHCNEDVEGSECGGDHHEEVASHHCLGVVVDEGQPALFRVRRNRLSLRRYLPTVRGETRMVSFSFNSLAIRSSPQVRFSAAISRISLRRSLGIPGLPGSRDFQRQRRRNPMRCQRMK